MNKQIAAVILGAGKGTRMQSDLPKVMMPLCGKPMIRHILETLKTIQVNPIVTVISADGELVKNEVSPFPTCVQKEQLGTGHAVLQSKELLKDFSGPILVIFGDTPLIKAETFLKLSEKINEGFAIAVLGFTPPDAARYGRLYMQNGELLKIIEYKDATDEERQITFCNSGCMAFSGKHMFEILEKIGNQNAAGEYYLTDAIEIARRLGLKSTAISGEYKEVASANTRDELALLETYVKEENND